MGRAVRCICHGPDRRSRSGLPRPSRPGTPDHDLKPELPGQHLRPEVVGRRVRAVVQRSLWHEPRSQTFIACVSSIHRPHTGGLPARGRLCCASSAAGPALRCLPPPTRPDPARARRIEVGQPGGQRARDRLQLGAHVPGEILEDALDPALLDQAVENAPAVEPQQVREDPAQPQAVVVECLLRAVADAGAIGDDLAPVAALLAQFGELAWRHVAGPRQGVLADAGQPQRVLDVGLAALDLLDVLRVDRVRLNARVLQRAEGRNPVHAGALHDGRGHAVAAQPGGELRQGRGSVPNRRKEACASPPGPGRRTAAVSCILWTSTPAARGTATCIESGTK